MIVTKSLPYETIKKQLKKSDKIGIISCNTCVRICGTGGEKALNRLALKLKKDGFKVVDKDLIGSPCDRNQLQKNQLHGNVQIVLACDAGVYNLRKIFPKHKIIPGLKTIGIGVNKGGKNIEVVKEIK
jgi:ferredoxin